MNDAMAKTDRAEGGVQSVGRAFDVLETLLFSDQPMGTSELSSRTGLPIATIHRLVATLVHRGYVRQEPHNRRYVLGSKVMMLTAVARKATGAALRPYLDALVDLTGETANFSVLDGWSITYVSQSPSPHMLRAFNEVGNRVPAHSTAAGKVMLAAEREQVVAQLLTRGLSPQTPRTITDPARFREHLRQIAEQGYAVDEEEQALGVRCVAVPLRVDGALMGALSVSGPAHRMESLVLDEVVAGMMRIACEASRAFAREEHAP